MYRTSCERPTPEVRIPSTRITRLRRIPSPVLSIILTRNHAAMSKTPGAQPLRRWQGGNHGRIGLEHLESNSGTAQPLANRRRNGQPMKISPTLSGCIVPALAKNARTGTQCGGVSAAKGPGRSSVWAAFWRRFAAGQPKAAVPTFEANESGIANYFWLGEQPRLGFLIPFPGARRPGRFLPWLRQYLWRSGLRRHTLRAKREAVSR